VYGVELLEDLHIGTQAAVRMEGQKFEWFDVRGGVRQGGVIAPLLINIYMGVVVKQALAQMPDGCGLELAYRADGKLQSMDRSKGATSMELISLLLYADDTVLLSSKEDELAVMLEVMDKVSAGQCWVCGSTPARQK
jgi:hypothetical protein